MSGYADNWSGFATHDDSEYPELWDGCVGAWNPGLGPTGSTLRDWSGVNNHGTLTLMDPATDWVVSGGGYALDFDGTNDYVSVANIASLPIGGIAKTISCWFRFSSNTACEIIGLGSNHLTRNTGKGNRFAVYYDGAGTIYAPEAQNYGMLFSWTYDANWHNIAIACPLNGNVTDALTYFDGRLKATTVSVAGTVDVDPAGEFAIGRLPTYSGGLYFPGLVDDVRMYNRVLTASEAMLLARRRGIAYETAHRRSYRASAAAAATRNNLMLLGVS